MYAWSNDEGVRSFLPEGIDYMNHIESHYGEEFSITAENRKFINEVFPTEQKTPEQIFLEKEVVETLEMELSDEARYVLHCLMWPDRKLSIFARLYSDYDERVGINCLRKWLVIHGWKHLVFDIVVRELKQKTKKFFTP